MYVHNNGVKSSATEYDIERILFISVSEDNDQY